MRLFLLTVMCFCTLVAVSQKKNTSISIAEVTRIEKILSSDEMAGRAVFTPGIEKAAVFIADEFRKAGLKPWKDNLYFQEFGMQRSDLLSTNGKIDGQEVSVSNTMLISAQKEVSVNNNSGYEIVRIRKGDTLFTSLQRFMRSDKSYVVIADTMHSRQFNGIKRFTRQGTIPANTIIVILSPSEGREFSLDIKQEITPLSLKNVVGILPGNSKKDEYVIFSGHYDHLGIGKPDKDMDSIFNGANDDASGITAVITLARHFHKENNNARTLVFAAFTAEESGGFGSQHFSKQFEPEKVMAMFNIEMIGTESKWGTNSAFITGYEKTDMGKILEKNLEGSAFKFYPDPYPQQQLFYRSDNATLARLGVPAHTISTSKMDSEPFYHTVNDEFETLDMKNMTEIIKAIAISAKSIISGADTPTRVDTSALR